MLPVAASGELYSLSCMTVNVNELTIATKLAVQTIVSESDTHSPFLAECLQLASTDPAGEHCRRRLMHGAILHHQQPCSLLPVPECDAKRGKLLHQH